MVTSQVRAGYKAEKMGWRQGMDGPGFRPIAVGLDALPSGIDQGRRTFAMTDFILAVAHHLLIFIIFGVLFGEFLLVRPGMSTLTVKQVSSIDLIYGVAAGLVVIVGFGRLHLAAKGWEYYSTNWCFWAKIGVFAAIGLLSVRPTMLFLRWRRAGVAPANAEVAGVRRIIHIELALFALLPVFAAAMARGYGQF
jgi:putative membrane protein